MFHKFRAIAASAVLVVGMSSAASATTIFTDLLFNGANVGPVPSMTFDANGIRTTVTGHLYTDNPFSIDADIDIASKQGTNGGLGACQKLPCGNPNLDGNPDAELLKFTFTKISDGTAVDVKLNAIIFSLTDMGQDGDHFDLIAWNVTPTQILDNELATHGGVPVPTIIAAGPIASMFGIGVDDEFLNEMGKQDTDQVRILGLKLEHECVVDCGGGGSIPLPAGLPLLASGLIAIGVLGSRRRRS